MITVGFVKYVSRYDSKADLLCWKDIRRNWRRKLLTGLHSTVRVCFAFHNLHRITCFVAY